MENDYREFHSSISYFELDSSDPIMNTLFVSSICRFNLLSGATGIIIPEMFCIFSRARVAINFSSYCSCRSLENE